MDIRLDGTGEIGVSRLPAVTGRVFFLGDP
jgi:hypothetical protein